MSERTVRVPGGEIELLGGRGTIGGRPVRLTERECVLLGMLADGAGAPVARPTLERGLGLGARVDRSVLDVAIYRLRAKIEVDPRDPCAILSAFGEGYRLVGPDARRVPRRWSGVGRARERAALAEPHPLTTLLGPPGVGKTTLAVWAAASEPQAVFVPLAAARDADGLHAAVADAVDLDPPDSEPGHAWLRKLGERAPALLILDNAEHLLAPVRRFVGAVAAALPGLRLWVTSRVALQLPGERVVTVDPLDPDEAVELLVLRAAEAGVAFDPRDPALRAVVGHLDHLPLAIELAAGRARIFGPAQLQRQLVDHRFRVLTRPVDDDPRHKSLWAALDWSWSLLDPVARRALAAASVFEGPFDAAAADAVLGPDAGPALEELADASLVRRTPSGVTLFHSVRAFVVATSSAEVRAEAELAHARHYHARLHQLLETDRWQNPALLDAIDVHLPELLAAKRVGGIAPDLVADLILHLQDRFWVRGPVHQYLTLLDHALAIGQGYARVGDLWSVRASARRRTGDLVGALADIERAVACGGPRQPANLLEQAVILVLLRRPDAATEAIDQLVCVLDLRARRGYRYATVVAGVLSTARAPAERIEGMLRDALADAVSAGDGHGEGYARSQLGHHWLDVGRLDEAERELQTALTVLDGLGREALAADARCTLAAVRLERGDPVACEALLARADALWRTHDPHKLPYGDLVRAYGALADGRLDAALDRLTRTAEGAIAPDLRDPWLALTAVAEARTGLRDRAAATLAELRADPLDPELVQVVDDYLRSTPSPAVAPRGPVARLVRRLPPLG